jgi:TM2 domain-containing membrane protein YozV
MFCSSCGASSVAGAKFCEKCGASFGASPVAAPGLVRGEGVPEKYAIGKSPVLAALLSFFLPPFAIGQFYNGDVKKGLAMLAASLVAIPLWFAGGFGSVLDFGIWVWSVADAYRVANRRAPLW